MKQSQTGKIFWWMNSGHAVTAEQAIRKWKCYRLAARIKDLRNEGWPITTTMVKGKNSRYAKYRMLIT